MKDQPVHMWPYWRDNQEDIEQALNSIKSAEKYLDFLMTELAEGDYE